MKQKGFLIALVLSFVLCVSSGFCADVYRYYADAVDNYGSELDPDTYPRPIFRVFKYDDAVDDANNAEYIRYYYDTETSTNVKIDQGYYEIKSLIESRINFCTQPVQDADAALQSWFESNWED